VAGLIELGFVYSIALGWAVWELYVVRRDSRRDAEAKRERKDES
jgi:hypothetical protein